MSANSRFLNLDTDGTLSTNSDTVVPSEKAIKTYVDSKTVSADGTTIENNANVLSAIGIKDQNTGNADKFWTGTKAEYENVATKDSNTTYRTTDEAEPESVRRIGEIVPSLLPLFDVGLHLLDGSVLSGVGVYSAFISYVAGLATNYPNLFTTEANWQSSVTTYGVCGKFVYDSGANTVRLPKITGIIEGTTDANALGDLVAAGLPNITGEFRLANTIGLRDGSNITGAFKLEGTTVANYPSPNSSYTGQPITFSASRSNSIYGSSSTVQPQTIKAYYYIVVATSTKTEIESDIDQIASDLNLKAGTDLANLSNAGSIVAAKASMPSGNYDSLTLGASGSVYTAPADGWFSLQKVSGTAYAHVNIYNRSTDSDARLGMTCIADNNTGRNLNVFAPAKKGDEVYISYNATGATNYFRFNYAEGSKSEKV